MKCIKGDTLNVCLHAEISNKIQQGSKRTKNREFRLCSFQVALYFMTTIDKGGNINKLAHIHWKHDREAIRNSAGHKVKSRFIFCNKKQRKIQYHNTHWSRQDCKKGNNNNKNNNNNNNNNKNNNNTNSSRAC